MTDLPPRPKRRRALWAVLILLLVVVAGYAGGWFYAAGELRERIGALAERQRARGTEVQIGNLDVTGFPVAFNVEIAPGAVRRPDGVTAAVSGFTAEARPWSWDNIDFTLSGLQVAADPQVPTALPVALTAEAGDGNLTLASLRPQGGTVALTGLRASVGTALAATAEALDAAVERTDEALILSGALRGLTLSAAPVEALQGATGQASAAVEIQPPPPERLDAASVAAWRDAGGEIRVERVRLELGPLSVDAAGTLTLDGALQPAGELTARVEGLDAFVQALAAQGVLSDDQAGAIRAGAALLGGQDMPLLLRDGKLYVAGLFPVADLPALVWPEA